MKEDDIIKTDNDDQPFEDNPVNNEANNEHAVDDNTGMKVQETVSEEIKTDTAHDSKVSFNDDELAKNIETQKMEEELSSESNINDEINPENVLSDKENNEIDIDRNNTQSKSIENNVEGDNTTIEEAETKNSESNAKEIFTEEERKDNGQTGHTASQSTKMKGEESSEEVNDVVQKSEFSKLDTDTFIGQVNNLTILQKSETETKSKETDHEEVFVDPSKPLKYQAESTAVPIISEEAHKQFEILKKERVLVVSCIDEKIAYDSARELAFMFSVEQYELRKIITGRGEASHKLSIDTFLNEDIGKGKNTVILVDVKSSIFFGSILSSEYSFSETIKELLRDKNIFLILSISSELWINDINERGSNFYFKTWNILFEEELELTIEKKGKIENLIPERENLRKLILYTITFFPGLNQEDFEQILQILLHTTHIKNKKKTS